MLSQYSNCSYRTRSRTFRLGSFAALTALTCLLAASRAYADDATSTTRANDGSEAPQAEGPRHFGAQRTFGLGPSLGWANGVGAMGSVELLPSTAKLWINGGYDPIFVYGKKQGSNQSTADVYNSGQVGGELALTPWHAGTRYDFGFIGGYRYNSVLGHGGGGGGVLTADLTPSLALFFSVELFAYPQANARLASAGYPGDRTAYAPWMQAGGNVGLIVYP